MAGVAKTALVKFIRKGDDGKPGKRGPALRGPLDWEKCASTFQFFSGAADEEFHDVVYYRGSFYACCISHVKQNGGVPGGSGGWWTKFQAMEFIATRILLSEKAMIEELTAGGIIMKDHDGEVVFRAHDGEVFAASGEFRGHVTAGDPNGMHVELDPSTPAMKVYDARGQECTSHTGEVHSSYTSLLPSGAGTGPAYASPVSNLYVSAINSRVMTSQSRNLFTSLFSPSGNGQMSFSVTATFAVTANAGTTVIQAAAAKVIVDIYDSSGTLTGSKVTMLGSMGNGIEDKTYTQRVSVNVQSGYKYMARIVVEAQGVNAQATAISTSNRSFSTEFFQSRFFGNGFALSQNTANYLIAMIENSVMRMRLAGELWYNKVKQPYTILAAQYIGGTMRILTAPPGFQISDYGSADFVYSSTAMGWHKNGTGQFYFGLGGAYDKNKVVVNASATTNGIVASPSFIGYASAGVLAVSVNLVNSSGTMTDSSFFVEIKSV